MPYGIPPTSIVGYRCVKCNRPHAMQYMPFCGWCGAPQPAEARLQALGLALSGETHHKRQTVDIEEIRDFLDTHRGKPMRVWRYDVSHCELEIRLRHAGGPGMEPWLNTLIYCAGVERIQAPTSEWPAAFAT